ncbi:calpain 7 [Geranomyces variabilis]|uniref:Calpain 7 n=1 Tax=Geranomyces variabilis TaxID=109894 RepID=A0AAD5TFM5_9FUNG|nr:calpain 7 [Geranomyces variabilis]
MAQRREQSSAALKTQLRPLYSEAFGIAARAVAEDERENWTNAKSLYETAARLADALSKLEIDERKLEVLAEKRIEYLDRAKDLHAIVSASQSSNGSFQSASDENVSAEGTLTAEASQIKSGPGSRRRSDAHAGPVMVGILPNPVSPTFRRPASAKSLTDTASRGSSMTLNQNCQNLNTCHTTAYSPAEVQVLRKSSYINGKMYLPWSDDDGKEQARTGRLYVDSDGPLALSPHQKLRFAEWRRAGDIWGTVMVHPSKTARIVQDVVTDCSVVASLSVGIVYERQFSKKLLTSMIFPQTNDAVPLYNSEGKYIVKLILNGVARRVVVDDFLPVDRQASPLCAFSEDGSIWPGILEKAYLKVWGGYGFPGSNSGIDLHAMTGWIPENVFFKDPCLHEAQFFQRLKNGLHSGNALITLGTPATMAESTKDLGLVAGHAYSVVDATEVLRAGLKPVPTLVVRNPWRKLRPQSPGIQKPQVLANESSGILSIPFADICKWFDTAHVNWNPQMWAHRHTLHSSWLSAGPRNDAFNLGDNPQYALEVDVHDVRLAAVWILLTKHVTRTEENTDYLTLHVYNGTEGRKVYYPEPPYVRGVYINNPHILLSQHEKSIRALEYTFTVYAMSPFRVQEVADLCPHVYRFSGGWTESTSGGSMNHASFARNPQYVIELACPCTISITLDAPKDLAVNLKIMGGCPDQLRWTDDHVVHSSGDYRRGFCVIKNASLEAGRYTIVPSTFEASCQGNFALSVHTSSPVVVRARSD